MAPRPVKAVSEATREREAFKYEALLAPGYRYNQDGKVYPGSELVTSSDSALTALAQLAAYQTDTEKAFISLFDAAYQYILVETAPSMPIGPNLSSDQCAVPLVLRGTAIPRDQGTCDHVLYLPNSEDDNADDLPLSFVPNLSKDARFTSRPYCQFGEAGQFYAAVPIRTLTGINIGALCVMSSKPPPEWNDRSTAQLRSISHAIMEQLELRRSKDASQIYEQMTRGMGSFINGQHSLERPSAQLRPELAATLSRPPPDVVQSEPVPEKASQRQTERIAQASKVDDVSQPRFTSHKKPEPNPLDHDILPKRSIGAGDSSNGSSLGQTRAHPTNPFATRENETRHPEMPVSEQDADCVYSKATNIIREALNIAGCVFFDVTLGSYGPSPVSSPIATPEAHEPYMQDPSGSSDEHTAGLSVNHPNTLCNVLGFSTEDASSIHGETIEGDDIKPIPERFLAKLLRRYPHGKIYNYDALGTQLSSDSSSDDELLECSFIDAVSRTSSPHANHTSKQRRNNEYSRADEGALIHQAFPTARSVAFIPLWDSKRDRWSAGGFIYTLTPTRPFSIDMELNFLRAFAKLISAENMNLEALRSDKAKSDLLGSLSHELRSPLHGIIFSTELLNDTSLTSFQRNTIDTIQTCCRTLLDTFDHLLDYSKINSFTEKRKRSARTIPISSGSPGKRPKLESFGTNGLYVNTDLGFLVEDVVDSVFAGFNFQHMSIRQFSNRFYPSVTNVAAQAHLYFTRDMGHVYPAHDENTQIAGFAGVSVCLNVDPTYNWVFHIPSGAIRRIVMNLFGNALKYTTAGMIHVSLTQEPVMISRRTKRNMVKLVVQDTGKGIGDEFLKHKLFKPFSQEDELQPGTGLGLSLVKTIVSQLDGSIAVKSQVNVGTIVTVWLPLENKLADSNAPAANQPDDIDVFNQQLQDIRGLRISLQGFDCEQDSDGGAVQDIAQRCLGLDVIENEQKSPDLVIWSQAALNRSRGETSKVSRAPNLVICPNGLAAYQGSIGEQDTASSYTFEFISQPLGPRKFVKAILLALRRWTSLPKDTSLVQRPSTLRRARSAFDVTPPIEPRTFSLPRAAPLAVERKSPSMAATSISPMNNAFEETTLDVSRDETILPIKDFSGNRTEPTKKLLLVDDNQINLKILSAFMKKLDRGYVAVTDGKQALDTYISNPGVFAGILMDISMPVMDGLEATRLIRAHESSNQLNAVAIFALTGLASDSTHREALKSGVNVFLTKPVSLKTLSESLEGLNKSFT